MAYLPFCDLQARFKIVMKRNRYWAERYLFSEPELKALQPFTSQDIDFKGSRDDVQRIAEQLNSIRLHSPSHISIFAAFMRHSNQMSANFNSKKRVVVLFP